MRKLILLLALLPALAMGQITKPAANALIDQRITTQIRPVDIKVVMKYLAQYSRQADSTALATFSGNNTWTGTNAFGTATVSADFAPSVDNFVRLGTSTNRWTFVYASQFMGTGATLFGTTNPASNILFRQGSTAQIVGGFLGSSNFILQAPSATLTTDTGHRFQNNGTTRLGGDVSVTGHIVPPTNTTYDLGSQTNGWRQVIGVGFLSPSGAQFGTYGSGSQIAFRQGTTSQLIGGAYPNTGNWTFQASAANLGTDTGERVQVEGATKLNGNVTVGGGIIPLTDATYSLGSPTLRYNGVYAPFYYTGLSTNSINFAQTSGSNTFARFHGTTNNLVLQPAGAIPSDLTAYRLQVTGAGRFTGNLVHAATGNYFNYNTSDETTNYERAMIGWNANVLSIGTESAGTGTSRVMELKAGSSILTYNQTDLTPVFQFQRSTGFRSPVVGLTGSMSQSSGTTYGFADIRTINQTATAGYNSLYSSVFEQALGSGQKFLINVGTNSAAANGGTHSPKFTVENTGLITAYGNYVPATNGSVSIGTSALRFIEIWAGTVLNASNLLIGSSSTAAGVYIRQGTNSQISAGWHLTTGNHFMQAPGSLPTDTGERAQIYGTMKVTGDVSHPTPGTGDIYTSPNGTKYKLTVSDAGAAVFTLVP